MKTHLFTMLLLCCLLFASMQILAQEKQIKVQIMHNNQVVYDTMLYKSSDEAKLIIENLVQRFTTDPVTIDTKLTHGLYVFNISNDAWKTPSSNSTQAKSETVKTPEPDKSQPLDAYEAIVAPKVMDESPAEASNDTSLQKSTTSTGYDDIETDSLFREFSKELDSHWNETQIGINFGTGGSLIDEIWEEIKKTNFQDDPDLKNLKNDFNEIFDKIKTTQIIIIQKNDTIKVD